MLKFLAPAAAGLLLAGGAVSAEELRIAMQAIDAGGVGAQIGTVTAQDGPDGLRLTPSI